MLTGTELFSSLGPPQRWRDAGEAMKAFADFRAAWAGSCEPMRCDAATPSSPFPHGGTIGETDLLRQAMHRTGDPAKDHPIVS